MKMETSLYDDDLGVKKLKRPMTLDFGSGPSLKKPKIHSGNLLSSPDLKLLQLASPELERMIIQQNGMVTTTPTPSQFICPKSVTEEQEAYARGFVDALNELHSRGNTHELINTDSSSPPLSDTKSEPESDHEYSTIRSTAVPYSTMSTTAGSVAVQQSTMQMQTNTTYSTATLPSAGTILPNSCVRQNHLQNGQLAASMNNLPTMQTLLPAGVMRLKEEPQIVPNGCSSPPMHTIPIDMEEQEVIKVERKRERNRVAARKCRNRKLERISRLEERVDELKGHNSTLASTASSLKDQVMQLKQQIMEHVSSGCQVMLSQNIL